MNTSVLLIIFLIVFGIAGTLDYQDELAERQAFIGGDK